MLMAACLLAPASAAASPALESLTRFFKDIHSFEARFAQVVLDENLNALDEGRGRVWIKRPGRFRWDYQPPAAQQIIGDGERVWLYDIDLEQVTVREQAQALGRSPAILLAGDGELAHNYELEDIGAQGRYDWVNLTPKNADSGFIEVRIGFEHRRLRLMELLDTLDQTTRIVFVDIDENAALDDALFDFEVPHGADLIDQTEP